MTNFLHELDTKTNGQSKEVQAALDFINPNRTSSVPSNTKKAAIIDSSHKTAKAIEKPTIAPATKPINDYEIEVTVIRNFTPQIAWEFLQTDHEWQRNIRKDRVQRMVNDMLAGRFRVTGDPVQFDTQGRLINGQHRCAAVINAGVTLRNIVVVKTYDPKAFEVLDQAAPRNKRDALKMRGAERIPNNAVMAAILFEHMDFKPKRLSTAEQLEILDSFPNSYEQIIAKMYKPKVVNAGMLAAVIRCMRVDRSAAVEFFTNVFNNNPNIYGKYDPRAHLLSTWIHQTANSKTLAKSAEPWKRECAVRCLMAWNAWRKDKKLTKLQYSPLNKIPKAV